jgi:anti-sigma factor RsiW
MTNDIHARARELMLDAAIGTLSTAETAELMRHLAECESCRAEQDQLATSVGVFRSASVTAPPFLAARTRAGVRFRAEQLNSAENRRRMISIAVVFDLAWTVLSIFLMFNAAQWFGLATASWMWIAVVSWFWLLPGLGVLMIVSLRNGMNTWLGAPHLPQLADVGSALEGDSRD